LVITGKSSPTGISSDLRVEFFAIAHSSPGNSYFCKNYSDKPQCKRYASPVKTLFLIGTTSCFY